MPEIGKKNDWKRDKRVSHHLLRRTARKERERLMTGTAPKPVDAWEFTYRVESSLRGPFGWHVVRYYRTPSG